MTSAEALLNGAREVFHHDEFMGFCADPATREMLVGFAESHGWPAATVQEGGISAAVQFLITAPPPRRLVVDLGDHGDPATAVQMLCESCSQDTVTIALGSVNDIKLYRELTRAGAADYLVKPPSQEALSEAIEKALRNRGVGPAAPAAEDRLGRLIVFVGARGGAGTSTLAMNSAWLMAHEQGLRVALVDLDVQFGTIALNLDLDPSHGLIDALENPSRIDGLFIASAMVNASDSLFVLASEGPLGGHLSFDPGAVDLLFHELCHNFDRVVVDLPRSALVQNQGLLAKATDILVVSDLSLPCVRDTMRMLSFLKDSAYDARVLVVANRVHRGGKGQISRNDFERGIETRVHYVVPEDVKGATASANAGKPLLVVAKRSPILGALRKIDLGPSKKGEEKGRFGFLRRTKT